MPSSTISSLILWYQFLRTSLSRLAMFSYFLSRRCCGPFLPFSQSSLSLNNLLLGFTLNLLGFFLGGGGVTCLFVFPGKKSSSLNEMVIRFSRTYQWYHCKLESVSSLVRTWTRNRLALSNGNGLIDSPNVFNHPSLASWNAGVRTQYKDTMSTPFKAKNMGRK